MLLTVAVVFGRYYFKERQEYVHFTSEIRELEKKSIGLVRRIPVRDVEKVVKVTREAERRPADDSEVTKVERIVEPEEQLDKGLNILSNYFDLDDNQILEQLAKIKNLEISPQQKLDAFYEILRMFDGEREEVLVVIHGYILESAHESEMDLRPIVTELMYFGEKFHAPIFEKLNSLGYKELLDSVAPAAESSN